MSALQAAIEGSAALRENRQPRLVQNTVGPLKADGLRVSGSARRCGNVAVYRTCRGMKRRTGAAMPMAIAATISATAMPSASVSATSGGAATPCTSAGCRGRSGKRRRRAPWRPRQGEGGGCIEIPGQALRQETCRQRTDQRAADDVDPQMDAESPMEWLATPHRTHAQATRAGTLNRKA